MGMFSCYNRSSQSSKPYNHLTVGNGQKFNPGDCYIACLPFPGELAPYSHTIVHLKFIIK